MSAINLDFEKKIWDKGLAPAGVDEAGRGPLAGPVVAAAVILSKENYIPGINDSKKLSNKKREELFEDITRSSISYSIGIVNNYEIDRINILQASIKAMEKAVLGLFKKPGFLLIDGNQEIGIDLPQKTIIKGDSKCASIAAASIIAKITRDRIMIELNEKYPNYNFKKHKGYPTREHLNAIKEYGHCPIHRTTFKGVLN